MHFLKPRRLEIALLVSLAVNLFLLPSVAINWFSSGRGHEFSVAELHPASVNTVALPPPKRALPKPKPLSRPAQAARKPGAPRPAKSKPLARIPLSPHILTQGTANGSTGPSVTSGSGAAGIPTAPRQPQPLPPPEPAGETRDAVTVVSPVPQIPESLKTEILKAFVLARFTIDAKGSATVTLLSSSGNAELDARTLDTLRQWRWKPALKNGVPVPSSQRLRVEFEVN